MNRDEFYRRVDAAMTPKRMAGLLNVVPPAKRSALRAALRMALAEYYEADAARDNNPLRRAGVELSYYCEELDRLRKTLTRLLEALGVEDLATYSSGMSADRARSGFWLALEDQYRLATRLSKDAAAGGAPTKQAEAITIIALDRVLDAHRGVHQYTGADRAKFVRLALAVIDIKASVATIRTVFRTHEKCSTAGPFSVDD